MTGGSGPVQHSSCRTSNCPFGRGNQGTYPYRKCDPQNPPRIAESYTLSPQEQGMPFLNASGRGDLLVKVIVKIPEKLTKKQEELMKEAFV